MNNKDELSYSLSGSSLVTKDEKIDCLDVRRMVLSQLKDPTEHLKWILSNGYWYPVLPKKLPAWFVKSYWLPTTTVYRYMKEMGGLDNPSMVIEVLFIASERNFPLEIGFSMPSDPRKVTIAPDRFRVFLIKQIRLIHAIHLPADNNRDRRLCTICQHKTPYRCIECGEYICNTTRMCAPHHWNRTLRRYHYKHSHAIRDLPRKWDTPVINIGY